jgi:hypothetical protein
MLILKFKVLKQQNTIGTVVVILYFTSTDGEKLEG